MRKRTQLELLVATLKTLVKSKKGVTIRELAIKSNVTWRFAKRTIEAFQQAGLVIVTKNKRFKLKT